MLGRCVERLDVDAAGRRLDPHLAAADDAVQAALVPEVREVGPEGAEALGRDVEVVRLGKLERRHRGNVAAAPRAAATSPEPQFPQGATFRQLSTVSSTVCVAPAPPAICAARFAISPHAPSFSTWSQSPSVYLYSI